MLQSTLSCASVSFCVCCACKTPKGHSGSESRSVICEKNLTSARLLLAALTLSLNGLHEESVFVQACVRETKARVGCVGEDLLEQ